MLPDADVVGNGFPGYHLAMRKESLLLPYAVTRLECSPMLILAPHPDDEIFGCAALLEEGRRSGADIHTIILTGGQAQGDPFERAEESREAALRLGTPEPEFWNFEDRHLDPGDEELILKLENELRVRRPALLALPSPAEIHPDHRALALAGWKAVQRCLEGDSQHLPDHFQLIACEISAPLRPNTLIDISSSWDRILDAARAFSTQNELRPYLQVLEAMANIRCLSLPADVDKAAGYYCVDREYLKGHTALEWASAMGPTTGLDVDDPFVATEDARSGGILTRLFRRVFGGKR